MHSAIYTGQLRHRRFAPLRHEFSYRLFMMYVDLSELDSVFKNRWLWSVKRPALAWLRRADYLGDANMPLDQAVRDRVETETGTRPTGPIRMLTHLRYFGVGFNPVTFYYCYDKDDTRIETIVAEITNTPWKERHAYVLSTRIQAPSPVVGDDCMDAGGRVTPGAVTEGGGEGLIAASKQTALSLTLPHDGGGNNATCSTHLRFQFKKAFHVSPFLSMDYEYDWRFSAPSERPGERLSVHMQNMQADKKIFDATLDLQRREISGRSLAITLLSFPIMTATVVIGIYWQALRLWLKRIPFHSHPAKEIDPNGLPSSDTHP